MELIICRIKSTRKIENLLSANLSTRKKVNVLTGNQPAQVITFPIYSTFITFLSRKYHVRKKWRFRFFSRYFSHKDCNKTITETGLRFHY